MVETDALRGTYMFGRLPKTALSRLAAVLHRRSYDEGEILFHKGDPGEEMYIVEEGTVAIFEPGGAEPGKERPLRIFRTGDSLGEMALIDREPRTLSARAIRPTQMLVLKCSNFEHLLRDPALAMAIMAGLNDRIRYTTGFLAEVRQWVERMAGGQYETAFTDMKTWVRQVAVGEYDTDVEEAANQDRDPTMATLAAEFAHMATNVHEREERLRQEIAQLKIEIDLINREKQAKEIVESDFFRDIKSRAKELRRKRE